MRAFTTLHVAVTRASTRSQSSSDVLTLARVLAEKKVPVTTTLALRDVYIDASGSKRRVFGTRYGDETSDLRPDA